MEALVFDTTFLIDFQRERKKGADRAHDFLKANATAYAYLPITVFGEYAEGFDNLNDSAFVSVVESFQIIEINREIATVYSRITRSLRNQGLLIGANDLWIAATAINAGHPLVTRNFEHFKRIEGIQLAAY